MNRTSGKLLAFKDLSTYVSSQSPSTVLPHTVCLCVTSCFDNAKRKGRDLLSFQDKFTWMPTNVLHF